MGPGGTPAEGQARPQADCQEQARLPDQVPEEGRAGLEELKH